VRLRIAVVMAVLAAALLLHGLARAEGDQGTPTGAVAATVTGFSDGNGVPIAVWINGFSDGNGAPTVGSADGFSDGNSGAVTVSADGGVVAANFGMSDGNG